jgi:hypothetical protein
MCVFAHNASIPKHCISHNGIPLDNYTFAQDRKWTDNCSIFNHTAIANQNGRLQLSGRSNLNSFPNPNTLLNFFARNRQWRFLAQDIKVS